MAMTKGPMNGTGPIDSTTPNQIQDSTHRLSCVEYTCKSRLRRVKHPIVLVMARFRRIPMSIAEAPMPRM
jgi:hypothetical protein